MKSFVRITKLSNIKGRGKYISDLRKQEEILAQSAPVDWTPYHEYEQAHQRTNKANNEGREVVVALPNEWAKLPPEELSARAQRLAEVAVGKSSDLQWAVHWNKARSNLHLHAVFSERTRTHEAGVYNRDVYLTADGRVARRKEDRAKNPDGTDKPPVHRKGESKGGFTPKDTRYKERGWVSAMKQQLKAEFERMGVVMEKPQPLHEYHEGNGKEAPAIWAKNEAIRENNANYARWRKAYPQLKERSLRQLMVKAAKAGKVLYIKQQPDGRLGYGMITVKEWRVATTKEQQKVAPAASARADQPYRSVSFAALGEAAREYYRETYALHDTRKPLDPAVKNAPADLQGAFADLQAARDRLFMASARLHGCKFWERNKKRTAQADMAAASRDCQEAFDRVASFGVSRYQDGVEQRGEMVDMEQLQRRVEWQVKDLQGKADNAAKFARPAAVLQGSPERQKAAQERFEQLCRDIPPEHRNEAREAIKTALTRQGGGMAAIHAMAAVNRVRDKLLPEQRSRTRSRSREQGHTR